VAQHDYSLETRPTSPELGALLLAHVSAATAARYGVTIQAEAVIDEEHRLILIVEAAGRENVERFVAFFTRFGSVQLYSASSGEETVRREGHTADGRI